MVKTKIERVEVGIPDVAAFRIEGKLGFHENAMVQHLVDECVKRNFGTVVFDFSELASLGGGVAKILRDFSAARREKGGAVGFVVTRDTITQFLQDGTSTVSVHRTLREALAAKGAPAAGHASSGPAAPAEDTMLAGAVPTPPAVSAANGSAATGDANVIFMAYDDVEAAKNASAAPSPAPAPVSSPPPASSAVSPAPGTPRASDTADGEAAEIISEIFGGAEMQAPLDWNVKQAPSAAGTPPPKREDPAVVDLNRQLKRRILELKTLFSISADFNAIWDRKKLLDIFLLTSIAQGGVESAVFLENQGAFFKPVMSKGVSPDTLARLSVAVDALGAVTGENNVIPVESCAMEENGKALVKREGFEYICPFRTKDGLSGIVMLGKRIAGRGMKQEDFEFLRILVNIAQGAYDNALIFEREHERTLGIVKTLISIIEENTLLKGTSEIVSRYVGMVAKNMDYPEENFKDLIYGTVLRDMGMVKVSDLILRSPRDLTKEEWEIIKRHPEDGAEMLSRMKFNEHVVSIVKTHHERFNGEGYPYGVRGKEIPLGSRIISVIESYAAMIHERPTRPALSEREALDTLKENYGLRYDREVVLQFARIMEKEIAQSVRHGAAVA